MAFVFLPGEDVGGEYVIYVVKGKRRSKPIRHLRMGLTIWSAMDGEIGPGDKGNRLFLSRDDSGPGKAK